MVCRYPPIHTLKVNEPLEAHSMNTYSNPVPKITLNAPLGPSLRAGSDSLYASKAHILEGSLFGHNAATRKCSVFTTNCSTKRPACIYLGFAVAQSASNPFNISLSRSFGRPTSVYRNRFVSNGTLSATEGCRRFIGYKAESRTVFVADMVSCGSAMCEKRHDESHRHWNNSLYISPWSKQID